MPARPYRLPFPALLPSGGHLRFLDPASGARRAVYLDAALTRMVIDPIALGEGGLAPLVWLPDACDVRAELASDGGATIVAHHHAAGAKIPATPDDGGLFVHLANLDLPASVTRVRTEGWARAGLGAGDYVHDAKATPDLAATHPRFCVRLKDGRCFRLADSGGLITVEQGGATGDPAAQNRQDDRPAFQGAIDYAGAVGIVRIGLAQARYSIWIPPRLTPNINLSRGPIDGHGLVLAPGQNVHFTGLGAQRATMAFRREGGRSFQGDTPGEAFQIVDGKVWRGCGIYMRGDGPIDGDNAPDGSPRPGLVLENLVFDGGTRKTTDYLSWPARVSDGRGWDTSHKGICIEPDRGSRDITILNCVMTGWRGETVFAPNDIHTTLKVRDSLFTQSNGQGLNPNGCMVDVENCVITDCFIGIEGWTGLRGGRIVKTRIERCYGTPDHGRGGAFAIDGGCGEARAVLSGQQESPVFHNVIPGVLDITCVDCANGLLGSKLTGTLHLDQTLVKIGAERAYAFGAQDVKLDIVVLDKPGARYPSIVMIAGGNGKAGARYTDRIDLTIAAGPGVPAGAGQSVLRWYGSLGPHIRAHVTGLRGRTPPLPFAAAPDFAPQITFD